MTRYVAPLLSDTFEVVTSLSSRELGREIQSRIASENKPTLIYVKGSQNTLFLEEGIKSLIDTSQYHLLPRQSDSWMKKKEDFFTSLSLES